MTSSENQPHAPRRRRVGRRSKLGWYAPRIEQWLREDRDVSSAEILNRLRNAGYGGGKTALYELVRRLRLLASG